MTDQELNEAVARKLGVPYKPCLPDCHVGDMGECDHTSNYCHSIEAAWEVVEYMAEKHLVRVGKQPVGLWFCTLDYEPNDKGAADTAPMAICKSFLKLESNETKT